MLYTSNSNLKPAPQCEDTDIVEDQDKRTED